MSRFRLLAAFLLLAAACIARAQPLPPGLERVTAAEGITEYRLPNGLRVVLVPDPSKPTVTVNITYLVGSRHEGYGETGMAHLLEHMLFKGTPRHPKLNEEFAPRGARRNGTTWYDRTNYYETVPSTPENLAWALEMEADRMVNSRVAREDLDSEMTVVRNEYERGENEPNLVLFKRLAGVAFDWHNYQNSPIGNRSDIENVGIDNLRAFYRRYYQPDNAVLVIAGKVDPAEALALVAKHFGPLPKPERVLPKLWTVEPAQDGERSFVVRRKGGTTLIAVAYRIPGELHADAAAVQYAQRILAEGPASRLHQRLVESGLAASVSQANFHTVDPGLAYLVATLKPDSDVERVRRELLAAIEEMHATPPTAEEMRRVRTLAAKRHEQTFSSPESLALALTESIARGDWRLFLFERQRYERVAAADVAAAAKRYFVADNRTVGTFLPGDAPRRVEIAAAPDAATALKDFKVDAAAGEAEAFDPSPANIDKRTTRRKLAEGLDIALLPKKTRGGVVHARLTMHYGDEATLKSRATAAGLLGPMLERGTTRYTRQQLADRFDALKATVQVTATGVTLRTTRENLAEALRLVGHVLREPSFPEAEFEQLRAQALTGIAQRKSDVNALAGERLARHFNPFPPEDLRYAPTLDEQAARLRAVKLDDVRAFHRDFLGASHAQLAIVGDFEPAEAMAAIESAFGGWNSPAPYRRLAQAFKAGPPLDEVVQVPDKANAVFMARLMLPVHYDDPDYPALVLANYLFGGGAGPSSRINGRMRQREGLSYGANSFLNTNQQDRVTTLGVVASAAPANMARIETAFREELARAQREGFSDEEIARAKAGYSQSLLQARSDDANLASSWATRLYLGHTFEENARFEARIQALTREQVNEAARRWFDPAAASMVKAGTL